MQSGKNLTANTFFILVIQVVTSVSVVRSFRCLLHDSLNPRFHLTSDLYISLAAVPSLEYRVLMCEYIQTIGFMPNENVSKLIMWRGCWRKGEMKRKIKAKAKVLLFHQTFIVCATLLHSLFSWVQFEHHIMWAGSHSGKETCIGIFVQFFRFTGKQDRAPGT